MRLRGVLWCLFTFFLVIENLAFGQVNLKIATKDLEFTETKPDNRLRLICPTCHRALYVCETEELFVTESAADIEENLRECLTCRPMIKGLPEKLIDGVVIACPYDGDSPIRTNNSAVDPRNGSSTGVVLYTNRGWQPTRPKPR